METLPTAYGPTDVKTVGGGDDIIIMLHGAAAGPEALLKLAHHLARPGRRLVIPALAGYGQMAIQPQVNALAVNLAIARALAATVEGQKLAIFGHSMGGLIGLSLVLELEQVGAPVTAAALYEPILHDLLNPAHGPDQAALAWDRDIVDQLSEAIARGAPADGVGRFIAAWNNTAWSDLPPAIQRQLTAQVDRLAWETRSLPGHGPDAETVARARTPALLLCGGQSTPFSAAVFNAFRAARPTTRAMTLPDLGHLAPMRAPAVVATALNDFFESEGL